MKLRKYTEQQLVSAVKESRSLAQTLKKLGVAPYGGNYAVLKNAIVHFNLDTSHFTGQIWNKGVEAASTTAARKVSKQRDQNTFV